jgi:hypothetical protein
MGVPNIVIMAPGRGSLVSASTTTPDILPVVPPKATPLTINETIITANRTFKDFTFMVPFPSLNNICLFFFNFKAGPYIIFFEMRSHPKKAIAFNFSVFPGIAPLFFPPVRTPIWWGF